LFVSSSFCVSILHITTAGLNPSLPAIIRSAAKSLPLLSARLVSSCSAGLLHMLSGGLDGLRRPQPYLQAPLVVVCDLTNICVARFQYSWLDTSQRPTLRMLSYGACQTSLLAAVSRLMHEIWLSGGAQLTALGRSRCEAGRVGQLWEAAPADLLLAYEEHVLQFLRDDEAVSSTARTNTRNSKLIATS
jgi:hypothetical protein